MVTLLKGETTCYLEGGPLDGNQGTRVGVPIAMALGTDGGFIYRLVDHHGKEARYRYDPAASPAHAAVVEADRQAIEEVAAQRGMTPGQLLAEVSAMRQAAKGGPHPAQVFLDEAARLGISPEMLLAQRGMLTVETTTMEVQA